MNKSTVIIRLDADSSIGSGHLMRCISIADELKKLGAEVIFATSQKESAIHVQEKGEQAVVLEGDTHALMGKDAELLAALAQKREATAILVDTYAVSPAFFSSLQSSLPREISVFYIDDEYLFSEGKLDKPLVYPVDGLINYGFNADKKLYDQLYKNTATSLYLGPKFAPVRPQFLFKERRVQKDAERILITTGSTNPNYALEKMIDACKAISEEAEVDVILGPLATLKYREAPHINVHAGLSDLAPMMKQADIAISAAGTTLYELCAAGLPTVAVPIVENQLPNIAGLKRAEISSVVGDLNFSSQDIANALAQLMNNETARQDIHERMSHLVDGEGAKRIALAMHKEAS